MLADRYSYDKPLITLMESMTQREFRARLAWINQDLDNPSKSDWYTMQVALEIVRKGMENPNEIQLKDMLLERKDAPVKIYIESPVVARSRWMGLLGVNKHG